MKWILFAVFAWLAWRIYRLIQRRADIELTQQAAMSQKAERMLRCQHCGTNIPESEAIMVRDQPFCSLEHQRAAQSK